MLTRVRRPLRLSASANGYQALPRIDNVRSQAGKAYKTAVWKSGSYQILRSFSLLTPLKMPQKLEGSCHCGAVKFTLESSSAVPYQICYCSICRKVAGGTGGTINLGGIAKSLKIEGEEHISKYHAVLNRGTKDEKRATSERNFCSKCSTMLWLWDETWPELIHPFASAIDSPLKEPKEIVCCLMDSKREWVRLPEGPKRLCDHYSDSPGSGSIEDWHKHNGEWVE